MQFIRVFFLIVSFLIFQTAEAKPKRGKQQPAKVYDCFPFMNEFELLKLRIDELNEVVDYFVLVESIESQRGHIKPLYFEEMKHLFAPYLDKIIHVKIEEVHPELLGWGREFFQRNCIARGLQGRCYPTDIILVSDADEIISKSNIPEIKRLLSKGMEAVRVFQDMYRFKLNWPVHKWFGTVATTYDRFLTHGAQYFRDRREIGDWPFIQGGWHFSSIGDNDTIRLKLFSVIEGGDNVPSDEQLAEVFKSYHPVPIDGSFPGYMRKNYDYLVSIGFIEEP